MNVIESIKAQAKKLQMKIVLPESEDDRVLRAAEQIIKEKIARVVLVGNKEKITHHAQMINVDLTMVDIVDPLDFPWLSSYVREFVNLRKKKGVSVEEAEHVMKTNPRYFASMMVRLGEADGMVAGSNSPTAEVLRAAMQVVKTKPGIKTISSCFIMDTEMKDFGDDGIIIFSDCGVVPNPTAEQLADIACSASESARKFIGMDPRVALLSFSTMGSAKHPLVDKVLEAKSILDTREVDFKYDGEMQVDAAIIPDIAHRKAPESEVAGRANVLVFPDLQSGNIAYKLVERFAKANAYGPLLQGLAKPVNDLSRGCSVQDIVDVVAITAVEAL